jgi:hypothetical protein
MGEPDGDGSEDGGCAVDDGQFVVAGGQPSPLFDDVEISFDDVAALVVSGVESSWSASPGTASLAVADLI